MYRHFIRPILFALNIERAHRIALWLLRAVGMIPGGKWLLHKCYAVEDPSLAREVFGLPFRNPIGLAAGFDRNGEAFRELSALGFGFVEIGTVTPRPQAGNPRPRVFRLPKDRAIVQRIGMNNKGLDRVLDALRHPHEGVIVGCSIGKNTLTPPEQAAGDTLKVFRNLYQYVDYFTVNIGGDTGSAEEALYTRDYVMQIIEPLFDFRRGQNQYRAILLKIPPDLSDETVDLLTDIMIETPLDGIVATNGTLRREGLQTSTQNILKLGNGRLSGAPLTRRAIEVVRRIHERSHGTYPIIGVGGLMSPDDVQAMLAAGASLVQLYTGFIYEGPELLGNCCRALVEAQRPKTQDPETQQAEAQQTEASQPETQQPETQQAETQQAEAQQTEASQPETQQPETQQPEAPQSEAQHGTGAAEE